MKKTPFLILITTLALMLFCACELPAGLGGGLGGLGGGNTSVGAFSVTVSERVVYGYTEGQSVTLGVDSSKAVDASKITYELTSGDNATIDEQGVLTFTGYGAATVKAKLGSKLSTNEITVYCSNLAVSQLDRLFSLLPFTTTDLDGSFVLLDATHTDYLTLESNDCAELVPCEDDDHSVALHVTGVTDGTTVALVDLDGDTVWSGTLASSSGTLSTAARNAALAQGLIEDGSADVPQELVRQITALALTDYAPASADGYAILDRFPALERLDLSGATLFDLSFLQGRTLKHLTLQRLAYNAIDLSAQATILAAIDSLRTLETIDLIGAFGAIDRTLCNELYARVRQGSFRLTVLGGVILDASNISDFMSSVFFSAAELTAHLTAHNGRLAATEGYSHAIVSLAHDTSEEALAERVLNADALSVLELYGNGSAYCSAISTSASLTLNLYDYRIYMGYDDSPIAIESTADLRINVMQGNCLIKGGDSVWIADTSGTWCQDNGSGIVCRDLTLYTAPNASLTVRGGNGNIGSDGVADGSDPSSVTSAKHGQNGEAGACAIRANNVTILSGLYYVYGGVGGKGGKGGDGSGKNIFSGGYNGGDGGDGGAGGAGICCTSYYADPTAHITVEGGRGGDGGGAGQKYAAGKNGVAGINGNTGTPILFL